MGANSNQWVIRTQADSQVKGPYTTEVVTKMIINGVFSGSEEICSYPEGEWAPLIKQLEFYDALMESLENPIEVDNKRTQKMEAETVIRVPEKKPPQEAPQDSPENLNDLIPKFDSAEDFQKFLEVESDKMTNDRKQKDLDKTNLPSTRNNVPAIPASKEDRNKILEDRDRILEIQLSDIKKLKQQNLKKLFPFVLAAILIVTGLIYFLFGGEENTRSGWILVAPNTKATEKISDEEIKAAKRKAARALQSGILEEVLKAQKDLVRAVESTPKDLETDGLLCVMYEQLWPYTRQTTEDMKAITTVMQITRGINPISNYSDTCQAIYLLIKGQGKEARSVLEKAMDNQTDERFSLGPFLYLMKAEILEGENNYLHASAYYDQAAKLWPGWVTAKFGLGRIYIKQNKLAEARDQFAEIYKLNKNSKAALLGLGLIELKTSRSADKAQSYFASGFERPDKIPKDFLTEAVMNYVQILIDKNEKSRALSIAQEGYRANPSHRGLKELVMSLGGSEKVENQLTEMILIGDQFARVGDHMVAQAQYKAAFELDPKNAMAAFKAAKSLWLINNSSDAIVWLEKSIKANPRLLQAYVLKADYESQKYNFLSAAKTLQAANKNFPKSHEVTKAQAFLEFRKNNMVETIKYGERAVKAYDADVELLSLLAQAHINLYLNSPSNDDNAQKKKDESRQLAERYSGRVIELEPAWPEGQVTYAKVLAGVYGPMRGELYLKDKIREFPYTTDYKIALAEFYKENEKFYDAAKIYEEIVSVEPKNRKANFGLAETYRIINRPALAQKYYNITALIDPGDVEPMVSNAKLLLETASGNEFQAKVELALAKLTLARRVNPEFPKVSYLLAKCYLEMNDYDKAISFVKDEKARNPNIADSYILAAEIFYRKSQFKECAAEYATAIRLRPNIAELYVRSAICYRQSGSIELAEDMLSIALQKENGYADIYREYGYILEIKNNKAAAVQALEKYLQLSPNASDRSVIEAKIRQLGG